MADEEDSVDASSTARPESEAMQEGEEGRSPGAAAAGAAGAAGPGASNGQAGQGKLFTLKKWNAVAMWSWDVDCDTCAICRVHVMDACLKCQADNRADECVVVWGECNHSFHNCCMSLWVQQNARCPLCQQDWLVQRIGK